ncbi:MAG: hypothetical protein BWY55_00688 [archaeon ADurb.Bin336]|nr:MAG: hypothetical protein BWY55_00688 [archaeon ADurb.Bin336]
MQRLKEWCQDINKLQNKIKYDFIFVDEKSFNKYNPTSFEQIINNFNEYK